MSIKILVKDKNLEIKEQKVVEKYGEIRASCGDRIFIDEIVKNIEVELLNEDIKLTNATSDEVLLINFLTLLKQNPSEDIPKQFNDINLLNQLSTKLEFLKNDLFDDKYLIKDLNSLNKLVKKESQEKKNENILQKSILFQYDKKKSIEVAKESFEVYEKEDFKIFLHS